MATYVAYTPTSIIGKALFNLDAFGMANYKVSGTVGVSVSDAYTEAQYLASSPQLSKDLYTSLSSGNVGWTSAQTANIDSITATYSRFIDLQFSPVADYSGATPAAVANKSDINISLIYRPDWSSAGESAGGVDSNFGYPGSRGDIVLNWHGFGSAGSNNDKSLSSTTFGFHALMHEIGHSLGLSHPHSSVTGGITTITADYAATTGVGFDKLGFRIDSPLDMNKEYFSVMSYDDQTVTGQADTFAQTPMILDVIALQGAYGEGAGTSGSGNDVIAPGGKGGVAAYRTYFDTGGIDTIALGNYSSGAYLHMGTAIDGAAHLVGVSMSREDENAMLSLKRDPASLRWFYGEYENALGSAADDHIVGNALDNSISGLAGNDSIDGQAGNDILSGGDGNDTLTGGAGNDMLDGGAGLDTAAFGGRMADYAITRNDGGYTVRDNTGVEGTDSLTAIERLRFSDIMLALDMDASQSGGEAALLIGAVIGKTGLANKVLVGELLNYFDAGNTLLTAATALLSAGIIDRLAGGATTNAYVNLVYHAVTGQVATTDDTKMLAALIDSGGYTRADFLAAAAELPENQANVGLVGLSQTGLEYS
ncbi:MAG: hypothetical protein NT159_18200 [Proteobacteria bacterium]|nr:hypothetical protein [Pseudomonadota bacterium]